MSINPFPLHLMPNMAGIARGTTLLDADAPEDVRTWLRYDRPAEYGFIKTRAEVPTRDGSVLIGTLWRPSADGVAAAGRFPSVLADFSPYDQSTAEEPMEYLAERGFVVLTCSVRGSMESAGEFDQWFPEREPEDNYDLIEWLAAQEFSDGHVGQTGVSYGSITTYRAAALRPPHLDAIVPIVSPTNIYSEWIRPGGVPTVAGPWWSSLGPVVTKHGHAHTWKAFQDHPHYDAFWQQVATASTIHAVEVPALHIGGYYDIFKNGGFDALERRPDKTWLLYGPWMHLGIMTVPGKPSPSDTDPSNSISYGTVLQWFDHWLSGRAGAQLPPARVVSFEDQVDTYDGSWKQFGAWPPANASVTRLYPTEAGTLDPSMPVSGQTEYFVNPFDGPSACPIGCRPAEPSMSQAMSEFDTRNALGRYNLGRAIFTTPTFGADTVVSGPVTFHLRAALTADDMYFVSKLEVLQADGQALRLETGYLRAQTRSSLESPEAVAAGEFNEYEIALGHMHYRFQAGQSLRITISGGDVPFVLPTNPSGLVTVEHGSSTYVDLPVLSA